MPPFPLWFLQWVSCNPKRSSLHLEDPVAVTPSFCPIILRPLTPRTRGRSLRCFLFVQGSFLSRSCELANPLQQWRGNPKPVQDLLWGKGGRCFWGYLTEFTSLWVFYSHGHHSLCSRAEQTETSRNDLVDWVSSRGSNTENGVKVWKFLARI